MSNVVGCMYISQEIHASGSVAIRGNNLGGKVKLDDFQMTLKWSKIGNLKMFLIQVMRFDFCLQYSRIFAFCVSLDLW